ncbi:MAG: transposase [Eubacterium sp.]|nr:transposase [Eubacterium sp.]
MRSTEKNIWIVFVNLKGNFFLQLTARKHRFQIFLHFLKSFGGTGSKASSPTARMSIAYDVLNDFIIDAAFAPLSVSERSHAQNHIETVENLINLKDAIFIMDRGYASEELIKLMSEKTYYLFRIRSKFNKKIDKLLIGSHTIVLYKNVTARVVKSELPSGEIETLLTNLFDLDETEFKELYFKRWRIEVKYDVVKNKLEMPCFSGFSENVIMQDFWISMYLANMAAIA